MFKYFKLNAHFLICVYQCYFNCIDFREFIGQRMSMLHLRPTSDPTQRDNTQ